MTTGTQLDKLRETRATAEAVQRENDELDAAGAVAREANAELLTCVIEAHRPALRALASTVGASGTTSPAGMTVEPFSFRGICVAGEGPTLIAREAVGNGYTRGRHGGRRLILDTAGTFAELTYEGPWSNVPGEVSSWTAGVALLHVVTVAARYNVPAIIDRLAAALAAQANGLSPARAVLIRQKAERIQALTKLIRSWR